MDYIYKVVSLTQFLENNKDLKIGIKTNTDQLSEEKQARLAIEKLLNHCAQDGWEYVRMETYYSDFLRTDASVIKSSMLNIGNIALPLFIFRQERTEENIARFEKIEKERVAAQDLKDKNFGDYLG